VPRIVKAADTFALTSFSEGLPVSLLEAMALAKPVVCTNVGGIPGVVTDGREGFLVPVGAAESLAEKLGLLQSDASLRRRLGEAGQARVRTHHDISVMVRQVEAEYRRILEEEGRGAENRPLLDRA
jgi:glycosyltransferase involved in cell wall biosynthesis